ncbi:MAG: prepilin-type N-terminal cleavage/methylation domain-containing protein [Nitrospirae bacterium]|nr:prepilin-type N-terminal cleavage/methylation domain-containing protein [Nitrospirota bacterium]
MKINNKKNPALRIKNTEFKKTVYCSLFTVHCSKGFTLLELLIAMIILSLVAVVIGAGYHIGINAWEKGEAEINETQRLRAISALMSQQMKSMYPLKMKIDNKDVIVFQGKSKSMLFATSLTNEGGCKWIRYSFKDNTLFFREGLLPDKNLEEKIEGNSEKEEVIDQNIPEFKFEYYSAKDDSWKDEWDFGETIPRQIRVTLSYFHPFLITMPLWVKETQTEQQL